MYSSSSKICPDYYIPAEVCLTTLSRANKPNHSCFQLIFFLLHLLGSGIVCPEVLCNFNRLRPKEEFRFNFNENYSHEIYWFALFFSGSNNVWQLSRQCICQAYWQSPNDIFCRVCLSVLYINGTSAHTHAHRATNTSATVEKKIIIVNKYSEAIFFSLSPERKFWFWCIENHFVCTKFKICIGCHQTVAEIETVVIFVANRMHVQNLKCEKVLQKFIHSVHMVIWVRSV